MLALAKKVTLRLGPMSVTSLRVRRKMALAVKALAVRMKDLIVRRMSANPLSQRKMLGEHHQKVKVPMALQRLMPMPHKLSCCQKLMTRAPRMSRRTAAATSPAPRMCTSVHRGTNRSIKVTPSGKSGIKCSAGSAY